MTSKINNWVKFHNKIRRRQSQLFTSLDNFPGAVLIAGCQRSGTTILSRIIRESDGFYNNFPKDMDDELFGALLLSGYESFSDNSTLRYCFQTTYLNENYIEYNNLRLDQKLIWIVREPQAVVYSMVYRWKSFALNELFVGCGLAEILFSPQKYNLLKYGYHFFPKLLKACYAYNGKSKQIFEIKPMLGDRIMIIEYEQLIKNRRITLEKVFKFIQNNQVERAGNQLVSNSLKKKRIYLTKKN